MKDLDCPPDMRMPENDALRLTHPSSVHNSVLIVEDDAILAVHLRNLLVGLGYDVPDPVATGEAAVAAVTAAPPGLVLMDIHLAGDMDGITAARHIRMAGDVPIVFLTSYSQDPLLQRAKMTAPYAYLIKPVSQRELAATIELVLYRHTIDCQRKRAEEALKKAHDELERRVLERTQDLLSANENLSRELEERRRREEILRVSLHVSEFAGAHSLVESLQKALDETERLTESRIGFFHFLEEDQQTLSLQTWSTSTLKTFCAVKGHGQHRNVDEAGAWADCIHHRCPIIHNEYEKLPNKKGLPSGHATIIRELVVPIMRGEKIRAILGVGNKVHDYDARDIQTVSALATMTWDVVMRKRAEETLRLLSSRLLTSQEDEKRRIAMELHDQTSQDLIVLKLHLAALQQRLRRDQGNLKQECDRILNFTDGIIEDVRRLFYGLRPNQLEAMGLCAALTALFRSFSEKTHIPIHYDIEALDKRFGTETQIVVYRIFQEALTNTYKHAQAKMIWTDVSRRGDIIYIKIKDDGQGFDPSHCRMSELTVERGIGLSALELRAHMIGADLKIFSQPGQGTEINLYVPINGNGANA